MFLLSFVVGPLPRYSLAKIGARALQQVHNTSYLIGSVPDLLALASGELIRVNKLDFKMNNYCFWGV